MNREENGPSMVELSPLTKPTILVADDDAFMLETLTHYLVGAGFEVVDANNGQEAIQAFIKEKPDLILLDGKMPVIDGFHACKAIKSQSDDSVPIIMVTALEDEDSVNKAFEYGADEYITKPINWAVLHQRIKRLLTQQKTNADIIERDKLIRLFFKHTPAAVAMFDTDMQYLLASHRWRDDYNLVNQSIIGQNHYDLLPDLSSRWKEIQQLCLKGNWDRSEAEFFDDEWGGSWYRWEAFPWRKEDDGIGGILMFTENITNLKNMEKEIKDHRDRLTFEREFIEEIVTRMRATKRFDTRNIRTLQSPVENTAGDMVLSAFRPDGTQHVLLGDFTGHGLSAATGGPFVSDIFYSMTRKGLLVPEILKEINLRLYEKTPSNMFMAAGFLELAPDKSQLTVWNCSIPDILIYRNGTIIQRVVSSHFARGMVDRPDKPGTKIDVLPGDRAFAFTDGFTEERDEEGCLFGQEAFERVLTQIIAQNEPLDVLQRVLRGYRTGHEQSDDMTIVELTW
ncbi:MAG: SpoIIE family protein phosphatase [Magnetococcales bacterium]|nr:SpoIIE family protein phosphatase [Magnetococcales bacterium]